MSFQAKKGIACGSLDQRAVCAAVQRMLTAARVPAAELSVVFLDGRAMRRLNRQALGHDYVTDVITFDLQDKNDDRLEGEICVCPAEARRNARLYKQPFEQELLRYIAHGILHLLGYDDATGAQRERMRKKEDHLLGINMVR